MKSQPADPSLFFSRQDPEDPRLGELASTKIDFAADTVHLFGWPDDEGIRLNGGRVGAAAAPDRIRRYLYKMTPALDHATSVRLIDRGNLDLEAPLRGRHEDARLAIADAQKRGVRTLSFGGGHDYGYADGAGFLDAHAAGARPLVVNFDAHLDVRPMKDQPHSGTPFRRLLEQYPGQFDFVEIGLQPQCNSQVHADWARAHGAQLWMASEVEKPSEMTRKIRSLAVDSGRRQPAWISLDIDAITSDSAPGCSAAWAWGLTVANVHSALDQFYQLFDVRAFSIYEVSPPLDHDDRTSKLAALFAHQYLFAGGRS